MRADLDSDAVVRRLADAETAKRLMRIAALIQRFRDRGHDDDADDLEAALQ